MWSVAKAIALLCVHVLRLFEEVVMRRMILCGLIVSAFGCARLDTHGQREPVVVRELCEPVAEPIVAHIPLSNFPEVDIQQKREQSIKKLINLGIFKKVICPNDTPKVFVLNEFMALSRERKHLSVGLVYDYYSYGNTKTRIVVIRDRSSGEDIGHYCRAEGGLKMNRMLPAISVKSQGANEKQERELSDATPETVAQPESPVKTPQVPDTAEPETVPVKSQEANEKQEKVVQTIAANYDQLPRFSCTPPRIIIFSSTTERKEKRQLWIIDNYSQSFEANFEIESVQSEKGYVAVPSTEPIEYGCQLSLEIAPPEPKAGSRSFHDMLRIKIKDDRELSVAVSGYYSG